MQLPVLLYHHVGYPQPGTYPENTVSPEKFERHVSWLKRRGYKGIRPSDWLAWCRDRKPLLQKPIIISFDDAYADVAEYALPVLRRYGFGGAIYVVTGRLGGTNTWDQAEGWGTLRLMSAEQIRIWASQGIEFGAHSRTHAKLTDLSGPPLEEEVGGSGEDLAELLGERAISFAYPWGKHNEQVLKSVEKSFELAFTTIEGLNEPGTPPRLLRRVMVYPEATVLDLALIVKLGWNPLPDVRWWASRGKRYILKRVKRIFAL